MQGNVMAWTSRPDHTLELQKTIQLPRLIDNIRLSSSGEVFAATFPRVADFMRSQTPSGHRAGKVSPVEIWRISGATDLYGR